jgi:hypothetical protein
MLSFPMLNGRSGGYCARWDVLRDGECIHGEFNTKREALDWIAEARRLGGRV